MAGFGGNASGTMPTGYTYDPSGHGLVPNGTRYLPPPTQAGWEYDSWGRLVPAKPTIIPGPLATSSLDSLYGYGTGGRGGSGGSGGGGGGGVAGNDGSVKIEDYINRIKSILPQFQQPALRPAPTPFSSTALTEQENAARNAAFGHAKDTAGAIARSAIDSLHGVASGRGMSVAGGENPLLLRGEADVIGSTGNQLGEFSRAQMGADLDRATQVGNTAYQGALTARGQDLSERGQNLGLSQSLLSLLQARGGLY